MKIKHIPLKKLKEIREGHFTSPTGKCYWDYQDQILERIYALEEKALEKMMKERECQELEYDFYNFSLEDVDIIEWAYSNFDKLMSEKYF